MVDEYKPKKEILDFLEKASKDGEKRGGGPILCAGTNTYTITQILEEVKKGTSFGKEFYKRLEVVFNVTEEARSGKPFNITGLVDKMMESMGMDPGL